LIPWLEKFPSLPVVVLGNEAKSVLMPELSNHGILAARGVKVKNRICAIHPAWIRRSIGKMAGKGEDKQDLSPTLMWDIHEAIHHSLPEELCYVEGVPPLIQDLSFASCDLETQGFDPSYGHITEIGWGMGKGRAYREHYTESHRHVYQSAFDRYPCVFHNALFDVPFLRGKNYRVENYHCSMQMAHLLTPDMPLALEFQNTLHVHYLPWKGSSRKDMAKYHATDLDVAWQLWDRQVTLAKQRGLWSTYTDVDLPVLKRMAEAKCIGIRVDKDKMFKLNVALGMRTEQIDAVLNKACPGVDWNSPKQLAVLLYDVLGLPTQFHKKTKAVTTDADALEELAEISDHPILKLMMQRRSLETMRTRYTEMILDDNNYYHHDVSFTAATGRARGFLLTMQKGAMRSLFIPDEPGWEFLYADWSQVELWISAIVSGDTHMQEFLAQGSFHAATAARFKGGPNDKTNPYYNNAKFITHGANFGRGEQSIARDHEIPLRDVQVFLKWLESEFPVWAAWRKEQMRMAYAEGQITNRFGFTRYFWSGNIRGMAYSFEPQSCPADMMKRTIISLWPELPQPARIVLPVHDALLIAYPSEMREEVTKVTKEHMEQPWKELGGWRATAEIGYGSNWQEAS
jgi:DNA polymerase I-like protein with 3'-5' exonuclease and polymerase domains